MTDGSTDPRTIITRQDFAQAITNLRLQAGLPQDILAARVGYSTSSIRRYGNGRSLPYLDTLIRILQACTGKLSPDYHEWQLALDRVRKLPPLFAAETTAQPDVDEANLLFRLYIPSERLYAAEADRLLYLFRDWLITTRRHGVRQSGYRTANGEMYEFFTDISMRQEEIGKELNNFSSFLTLCSTDPAAAADTLAPLGLGRANSSDLVARFGREVRRLQMDLAHERERRMLIIRHSLEEDLVAEGFELQAIPSSQIHALIDYLVPGSSASTSLTLLAGPQAPQVATTHFSLNVNHQVINAMESMIIQNVQGTAHLGSEAKELLALIERFGDNERPLLEAAVHQLEDQDAPPVDRSAAKRRLKKFLTQLTGSLHDVGLELLEKYLEKKIGM